VVERRRVPRLAADRRCAPRLRRVPSRRGGDGTHLNRSGGEGSGASLLERAADQFVAIGVGLGQDFGVFDVGEGHEFHFVLACGPELQRF